MLLIYLIDNGLITSYCDQGLSLLTQEIARHDLAIFKSTDSMVGGIPGHHDHIIRKTGNLRCKALQELHGKKKLGPALHILQESKYLCHRRAEGECLVPAPVQHVPERFFILEEHMAGSTS